MIARGTTPSLTFTFHTVNVSDIEVAYLTVEQLDENIIEKTKADAMVDPEKRTITWTLTQEETLSLNSRKETNLQLRYRLVDNSAFVSQIYPVEVREILKEGVI